MKRCRRYAGNESRSPVGTEDNLELVREDKILEDEIASIPNPKEQTADGQEEEFSIRQDSNLAGCD